MKSRFFIFFHFIVNLFTNEINIFIAPAITITTLLKQLLQNPKLDLCVLLTSTGWDDIFLEKVRAALDLAITDLGFFRQANESRKDMIHIMLDCIDEDTEFVQNSTWAKLASLVAQHLSNHTITESECDLLCQIEYINSKK